MNSSEIEVSVCNGSTFIQRWPCTRTRMPDGMPGVIWRGVAYKLLADDRIDVGASPQSPASSQYAVLPGTEASWVLVQGSPDALDSTRRSLQGAGVTVTRTGRWLGEPVDDITFDWFLRSPRHLDSAAIADILGGLPSSAPASAVPAYATMLEQKIASLTVQLTELTRALQQAPIPEQASMPDGPTDADRRLDAALLEVHELQASLAATQSRLALRPPQNVRLHDELENALTAFRPDLVLLRGSLEVAIGEFGSRAGFFRAIQELPASGSRPDGWKKLAGADRWWERHVSTGRDNSGRAYARFDPAQRQWSLLLGWKTEQASDIAWLRLQRERGQSTD